MPLTIPVSVNYPSPLQAIPSLMQDEPTEGRKQVPCEILWGSMGGAEKSVAFNLQNNATLNVSQIATLKVDNSKCGADVTFIFPDTLETIEIPGYSPTTVVPVFSNGLQFYVSSPNSVAGDVTRFQLLNYRTFPVDIPASTGQEDTSLSALVNMATGSTTQVIPAGVSGTVTGVCISAAYDTSSAAVVMLGTLNGVASVPISTPANQGFNGMVFTMANLDVRFTNGLTFSQSLGNTPPTGATYAQWAVNVFYRTSGD